jgi:hypothetical protein
MDGWPDGWIDGWMYVLKDGFLMERLMDGWIDGYMDRWVVDWMDLLENGQMEVWIYG